MAGVRVDHVIACVAGGAPRSYGLAGQIDPGYKPAAEQRQRLLERAAESTRSGTRIPLVPGVIRAKPPAP